jgi:hypothetical protein
MPRYFFNVYHDRTELDEEGEELPDAQAAWREATVTAGQIIQDLDGRLRPGHDWRLEVTDEFANPLYSHQRRPPQVRPRSRPQGRAGTGRRFVGLFGGTQSRR